MRISRIMAVVVTAAALPVTFLAWTPRSHAQDDDENSRSLGGSWVVTVTPNPIFLCGGPQVAPAPLPFTELATYAAGGTLTETNTQLNANSATLSPSFPFSGSDGHGVWERGGGQFEATFRKLVFDPSGVYVANADISEKLTLQGSDHNRFSGSFTIMFSFVNNNPPLCSSGELEAKRIVVD